MYQKNTSYPSACGWHNFATDLTNYYKIAWVGVPLPTAKRCYDQVDSPNNAPFVDAAVNILAHELAETVTDPNVNGWYFNNTITNKLVENADQCIYNYGNVSKYTSNSGARYNMEVNGRKYFIQTNWNLRTKSCELQ